MRRIACDPRPDWQSRVEKYGLVFHTNEGRGVYWDESARYEFEPYEITHIEAVANELHGLCLNAARHVIENRRYAEFGIPARAIPLIEETFRRDEPRIYGRFDFSWEGGDRPPQLLEYNADTPTSLLEAGVIQWRWLEDVSPQSDQFNSIWEALIAEWTWLRDHRKLKGSRVFFAHADSGPEDRFTITMLEDTALEAGLNVGELEMSEIGWDEKNVEFVDLDDRPLRTIFKLYPWEWMWTEAFGEYLDRVGTKIQWLEPAWKMLLSNKALLAILHELYPDHPSIPRATLREPRDEANWVRKPLLSREGANIRLPGRAETTGDYGAPYVWQEYRPPPRLDGNYPIMGVWIIGDDAHGMGIRETREEVTDDLARFVPHLMT